MPAFERFGEMTDASYLYIQTCALDVVLKTKYRLRLFIGFSNKNHDKVAIIKVANVGSTNDNTPFLG